MRVQIPIDKKIQINQYTKDSLSIYFIELLVYFINDIISTFNISYR